VLLLHDGLLVKTERFKKPRYVGDPVNAVRIFNEKEVDELVVLDMDPCRTGAALRMDLIEEIAGEAFMPVAYGGGIDTVDKARALVSLGIEKVVINSAWFTRPNLIAEMASTLGSQAVVGSVDVKSRRRSLEVFTHGGKGPTGLTPVAAAVQLAAAGAGELFLNSIDRDGTMRGFDVQTIREVADAIPVPLLACGGAGGVQDLEAALRAGASAVAAGSMFVFHGRHRAVLITYPGRGEIAEIMERIERSSRA
jgi:cyclase